MTYLLSALDEIERSDKGVGSSASEDTTESASGVVFARVELDLVRVDLGTSTGSLCSTKKPKEVGSEI